MGRLFNVVVFVGSYAVPESMKNEYGDVAGTAEAINGLRQTIECYTY